MRLGIIGREKPERVFIAVRNAEASSAILQGQPVAFILNGTNDGNDAVLPATATGALATTAFAGVSQDIAGIPNARYAAVQIFGICGNAMYLSRTRAASTDSWSTAASVNTGAVLTVDTINNCFGGTVAGAVSAYLGFAILAQSIASIAGSASSTSNSSTAQTALLKVFLRAM